MAKKRKDGRYCKNITIGRNEDGSLKRKMVFGSTIKELDIKVAELLLQVNKGVLIDDKNKTVDVWSEEWLQTYMTDFKESTKKKYRTIVSKYIKPNFKDVRLKDLKQFQVQKALNKITSPSVPQKFLTVLNKILDSAVENDYIVKNVAKSLKVKAKIAEEKQPLTVEQVNFIKEADFSLHDICVFLIYSGLRINELINLTWDDVNLKTKTIKIHGDVKTPHSNRIVPLFAPALNILKVYDKNRIKNIKKESDHVFLIDGAKCKISDLSNIRLRQIEVFGFHFTFHQLRHTFVTTCYNAGIDAKQTQEWVGHKSIGTTMNVYTHLDKQNKKDNTDRLNKYLKTN